MYTQTREMPALDELVLDPRDLNTREVVIDAGDLARGSVLGAKTATGNYILSLSAAGDGSEVPSVVLAEDVDASTDPKRATVYVECRGVDEAKLVFGTGHDADSVRGPLAQRGIYLEVSV